ncbi:hypothetical protein JAAARDRAFT_39494 [Jaapia argillacea MUCL 33604]|uniref:Uncharacterized protein n=1 Tax=Jaapia argillacea MUCL 33604 TaxID=933084 RepID=A0A067PDX5_9AGAM|nr:hypothetical protein JAAARDRAFT_39494 [Jaapia argillacea MUCL 33604]
MYENHDQVFDTDTSFADNSMKTGEMRESSRRATPSLGDDSAGVCSVEKLPYVSDNRRANHTKPEALSNLRERSMKRISRHHRCIIDLRTRSFVLTMSLISIPSHREQHETALESRVVLRWGLLLVLTRPNTLPFHRRRGESKEPTGSQYTYAILTRKNDRNKSGGQ